MWQNILVIIIVLACAFAIARRFFRQAKGKAGGCGSGCGGCSSPPAGPGQTPSKPSRSARDCSGPE